MDEKYGLLDWYPESGQIEIQFSERLTLLLLNLKEKGYVQTYAWHGKEIYQQGLVALCDFKAMVQGQKPGV